MLAEASLRFSLPESFELAVQSVCGSMRKHGMRVAGQLDISRRLERSLAMLLEPCTVLFVLPDPAALSAPFIQPQAAVFLPLHVVISGNGNQCEVQIQNRIRPGRGVAPPKPYGPVVEAQRQLSEAIQAIALRTSLLA